MRFQVALFRMACCVFCIVGCNPFQERLKGEFNAGSADPANYPPPYRGVGATRNIAGSGSGISAARAFVANAPIEHFIFPYAPTQVVTAGYSYPTALSLATQRTNALQVQPTSRLPIPLIYVFDPPADANAPAVDSAQCTPPTNYTFDQRRDDVPYNQQGNIFTKLPEATFGIGTLPTWDSVPLAQRVTVTSGGEPCQGIKSERTLLSRSDVQVGAPANQYLAWALVDPGSAIYRVGESATNSTGVGTQRWGWFQRFLVAYLDGGAAPLNAAGTQFRSQRLFIPNRVGPLAASTPGRVGAGYDVVEFTRSSPNYSPICEVWIFDNTVNFFTAAELPKSVAAIPPGSQQPPPPPASTIVSGDAVPPYVFCLQVQ